ncbi:protein adenylyltransferase FICD-like isoform X2 [Watersipora subatra]
MKMLKMIPKIEDSPAKVHRSDSFTIHLTLSKMALCCSVIFCVLISLLVHLIITNLLLSSKLSHKDELAQLGNHLFAKPSRQQNLVRFPSDVSWFTSMPGNGGSTARDSARPVDGAVTSHAALDARTIQNIKHRLKAKDNIRAEAHASYRAAVEMVEHGKKEKAQKLLQHAVALNPLDADILNAYGEFLLSADIVLANHMFKKASVVSPTHTKALINLQRTAGMVEDLDSAIYNRIANKRDLLLHIPESHPALRRLKTEIYYKHIYHTVAIEGNTLNLYETRAIIETRVTIGGKSISEHNEVIGMDAALSYINSTLLNRLGRITLQDILEIHRRVLGFVDPIEAGQLRNTQVFVGDFTPPRPGEVQVLMEEFIDWLNSDETVDLHPIKFAAIAHYRLVTIHPFYDGNGRTSRLLMNLILMHAGYPPVMIRVQQKHEYYKHLETANQGDIRPFIRFIADCTEATVDEYMSALSEEPSPIHNVASDSYVDDGRTIIVGEDDDS